MPSRTAAPTWANNSTLLSNTTIIITNSTTSNNTTTPTFIVVNTTVPSPAGNSNNHADEWSVTFSRRDIITSVVLLSLMLLFFAWVVAADMVTKARTGELAEDMRGLRRALLFVLTIVPFLCVVLARKAVAWCKGKTDQAQPDVEADAERTRVSQAVVDRLGSKSSASASSNQETIVAPADS